MKNPEQTRRDILEAAFDQIYRHGFQATGINAIVNRTRVTKGAFYHHFPTKRDLGFAVIDEVLAERLEQTWLAPLSASPDPVAGLKTLLTAAVDAAGEDDLRLGCPINNLALEMSAEDEGFRVRIERLYDRWRSALAEALKRGQRSGWVRPGVRSERAAGFVVAALAGCRSMAKNARDLGVMRDCLTELFNYLDALRPRTLE
jgi:AcrR family transcriptional regulator